MSFFKSKVFVATAFFLFGMATQWLWMKKDLWSVSWSTRSMMMDPRFSEEMGRDPFESSMEDLRRMQEQMLRSFQGFQGFGAQFQMSSPEITETEDGYRLELALQGMSPKNFSVQIERGQIRIEGSLEEAGGGGRALSRFSQSFPVPADIDADQVRVETLEDRLVIHLPKKRGS